MEFQRANRLPAEVSIPDADVRLALDNEASARLQKVLPALAAIYLVMASVRLFLENNHGDAGQDWLAYGIALTMVVAWTLLRRGRIPADRVHLSALVIGGLILLRSLLTYAFTTNITQVFFIVALLLGSAATLLAWRGVAFIGTVGVAAWIMLAADKLPSATLMAWSVTLVAALAGSIAGIRWRMGKQAQIERTRLGKAAERLEEKLTEESNRQRFNLAVQGTEDGLWYWDLKSEVFEYSSTWAEMLGYEPGELDTNVDEWFSRVHPGYLAEVSNQVSTHLHGESTQFRNEHRLLRKDGSYIWVLARGTAVRNQMGEAVALAGSHANITSLIEAENRLLKDSFQDKLTSLANRDYLMSCLEKKIERQKGSGNNNQTFAVIFLDLDGFKVINDSLGHPVGDELLAAVLLKHFADRGLGVAPDVVAYLVPRIERSLAAVAALAAVLDRRALAAGRPVTVRLARAVGYQQGVGRVHHNQIFHAE